MTAPLITGAMWVVWCILHSLLICRPVTSHLSQLLGSKYPFYRLCYNLLSFLGAAGILRVQVQLARKELWDWHGGWLALQAMLLLYALYMFVAGARRYDLGYFLGIRQIGDYLRNEKPAPLPFSRAGVLRRVRHPWYSGALAFLWGAADISDVSLAMNLTLSCYLVIGSLLEEKKLLQELGEEYAAYRRQVPMLIPWKIF